MVDVVLIGVAAALLLATTLVTWRCPPTGWTRSNRVGAACGMLSMALITVNGLVQDDVALAVAAACLLLSGLIRLASSFRRSAVST